MENMTSCSIYAHCTRRYFTHAQTQATIVEEKKKVCLVLITDLTKSGASGRSPPGVKAVIENASLKDSHAITNAGFHPVSPRTELMYVTLQPILVRLSGDESGDSGRRLSLEWRVAHRQGVYETPRLSQSDRVLEIVPCILKFGAR